MSDLQQQLKDIQANFTSDLANVSSKEQLQALKDTYLGRKNGKLTAALKSLKDISDKQEKRTIGQLANTVKSDIQKRLSDEIKKRSEGKDQLGSFDATLPGTSAQRGYIHPLRQVQEELIDIFYSMGFTVMEGNELETDDYCFEFLNIPPTHPARDLQDTFYVKEDSKDGKKQVLRTHTSNMQVRMMEKFTPPLRVIVPGRVFRNESTDASHDHTFYQLEGFVVGDNISVANLTYVLKKSMSQILQREVQIRLRPGYFPYVEP